MAMIFVAILVVVLDITFNEFNIATVWHATYTINFKDERIAAV